MNFGGLGFAALWADERTWRPSSTGSRGVAIVRDPDFPLPDPLAAYRQDLRDAYARHTRQALPVEAAGPPPRPRGGRRG